MIYNTSSKIALVLAPPFWPKLPPLSLVCLGSYLLEKGLQVSLLDLNNEFYNCADAMLQKEWIQSCNPSFCKDAASILQKNYPKRWEEMIHSLLGYAAIGFSCHQSNIQTTLLLAETVKSHSPETKIIFGGPEITRFYFASDGKFSEEMHKNTDLLVVGEGEKSLWEFFQDKISKKTICFNELDDLNSYNLIQGYQQINFNRYPRQNTVALLLSRGCLNKCRFCSERLLYKKARIRSIENIILEIDFHLRANKIESFVFHDSMLNINLSRLERLCDAIIKRFGSISWEAQMAVRPNMSEQLLKKLKQSGCYNLFIGLESGCDDTLFNMHKGFTSLEAAMFFKKLHKAELSFGISIIVGYPGETEQEAEESLRFLIANKDYIPKIEQINPYVYYEGTDLKATSDAYHNPVLLKRVEYFVNALKQHGFKITNAFINNLIKI